MKIQKRRRREFKTNYKLRLGLLKSEIPRIIIRKTNKYIIAQYVESKSAQDRVVIGATSKKLLIYGFPKEWKGSLKSIPASYLTGFFLGKKIINKINKKIHVNIDLGLNRSIYGSRIYAVIKGLLDAGIDLKYKEEILPPEGRITGNHMKKDIIKVLNEIKEKIENEFK